MADAIEKEQFIKWETSLNYIDAIKLLLNVEKSLSNMANDKKWPEYESCAFLDVYPLNKDFVISCSGNSYAEFEKEQFIVGVTCHLDWNENFINDELAHSYFDSELCRYVRYVISKLNKKGKVIRIE